MAGQECAGRRRTAAVVGAVTTLVLVLALGAGPAGAQAQLDVQPMVVAPGGTVMVAGVRGLANGIPAEVRLDDVSGRLLATATTAGGGFGPIEVTIPADVPVGPHVLLITQPLRRTDAGIRGLPAKLLIQVTGPGGLPVRGEDLLKPVPGLPADLAVEKAPAPATGTLILIGLAVAAVLLVVAVPIAVAAGRRKGGPTRAVA